MQRLLGALTAATLFIAAYGDAVAFPVAVLKAAPAGDIGPVAQGCGPNRYCGPGGACHLYGRAPLSRWLLGSPVGEIAVYPPFHGRHPDGS
jgi:hypothetical protein